MFISAILQENTRSAKQKRINCQSLLNIELPGLMCDEKNYDLSSYIPRIFYINIDNNSHIFVWPFKKLFIHSNKESEFVEAQLFGEFF